MRKDLTLKDTVGGLDFVSSFLEKITKERKPKNVSIKKEAFCFVQYLNGKVREVTKDN